MTPSDLEAIEARANAWSTASWADICNAARTDVPNLIAEVRRLQADMEDMARGSEAHSVALTKIDELAEQMMGTGAKIHTAALAELQAENSKLRAQLERVAGCGEQCWACSRDVCRTLGKDIQPGDDDGEGPL